MNNLPAIEIYSIGTELLNGQIQGSYNQKVWK